MARHTPASYGTTREKVAAVTGKTDARVRPPSYGAASEAGHAREVIGVAAASPIRSAASDCCSSDRRRGSFGADQRSARAVDIGSPSCVSPLRRWSTDLCAHHRLPPTSLSHDGTVRAAQTRIRACRRRTARHRRCRVSTIASRSPRSSTAKISDFSRKARAARTSSAILGAQHRSRSIQVGGCFRRDIRPARLAVARSTRSRCNCAAGIRIKFRARVLASPTMAEARPRLSRFTFWKQRDENWRCPVSCRATP